ncbi:N-acetyltransferase [Candidatus Saccharibacteria bacterium CG_4_10_14_0_2_um_filter_52_9]|nr:MAG: N-acetyltransferase [Candidatus Saccharibacteria bacterium CG_4_10_14_0_2_um_filter_52_9]
MSGDPDSHIESTALIEKGAKLGRGVKIWHYAHIRKGAMVGDRTIIGRNVQVDTGVRIGTGCKIQNGVSVYSGVTLEDDVFVGPFAVFTNDLNPRAFNQSWKITPTMVHKGASIGANATIICGNEVGEYAMVAAGAVVTKSVQPYQLVAGVPARHMGWVNKAGELVSKELDPPADLT